MARKTFSRTVVKTICEVDFVDKNNETPTNETVELYGDYNISAAHRAVLEKLDALGVIITSIRHESFFGSMSIELFARYCEKKNYKEW